MYVCTGHHSFVLQHTRVYIVL